jgi:hypothetical protein
LGGRGINGGGEGENEGFAGMKENMVGVREVMDGCGRKEVYSGYGERERERLPMKSRKNITIK